MHRRGFTVVEILVVLTIMGVLLVLGVVNLRNSQINSRDTERKTDIDTISTHLETFYRTGTKESVTFYRYPSLEMFDGTEATLQRFLQDANMTALTPPGVANAAAGFVAAENNDQTITGISPQPTINQYVYQPLMNDGNLCTTEEDDCVSFNLFYRLEADDTIYKVSGKNKGGNPDNPVPIDPLQDGLVAWWKMNGNANDSARLNNGNVIGAVPTTGQNGQANGAYSFNGVNSFIEYNPESIKNTDIPLTVSAWVRWDMPHDTMFNAFSSDNGALYNGFWFNLNASGTVSINYGDGTGGGAGNRRSLTSTSTMPNDGNWHHVVGIIRGATDMSMYVDGTSYAGTYSGTGGDMVHYQSTTTYLSTTGSYYPQGPYFGKGSVDDLRIYDRDLSASEVSSLYSQGAQ